MGSKDLSKLLKGLSLKNKNDIYILLLGQKSIGKSTFINALSNSFIFDKLKDAREDLIRVLLPCRLSIKDKSSSCHLVKIGTANNTDLDDSEAFSTKKINTYVIPLNEENSSKLHIIDTPGFEGPYGIDQDKRLCDDILTYIAPLQEVHAICWFLSATDLNTSSFFDYCVKIILARIDKRSYENLVFCFSKTRDFTSGEAWLNLEKLINSFNESSSLKIKWSKSHDNDNNIFCFENDFFRYLAGVKLGYSMDPNIYSSNWEHTVREMKRMLSYILDKTKAVPLKNSTCINEGRRLITTISQPLFDILQSIQEQISVLETHKLELMSGSECLADLKQKLYFPIVNLEPIPVGHPYLVCGSNKCLQLSMDWGTSRWELPKEKCHEKCYLPRLPSHMVGGPELMKCEQIDESLQLCKKCTCHFSLHLHLYYSLKWSLEKVDYSSVEQVTPSEVLGALEKLREDIDTFINFNKQQEREIVINLAQFAHFMENTSITPYQCCYDDYIQSLIHRLESVLLMPNPEAKTHLLNLQSIYRQKKADYDTALSLQRRLNNDSNLLTSITCQKIMENVAKIYNLDKIGKKIRQLMKVQKTARQIEHQQTVISLLQTDQKVQKDKLNEAKKYKKKNKDKKKTSSSDSDDDLSSKVKNDMKSQVKKEKVDDIELKDGKSEKGKANTNSEEKGKNRPKNLNSDKAKVKPWNPNQASTSQGAPSKKGTGAKPVKKDKFHPKVPPPSYESLVNQGSFHPNNPGLINTVNPYPGFPPNVMQSGTQFHTQGHTIEVKVSNAPPHSAHGAGSHHPGPVHSPYPPHSQPNFPSFGSASHGPMPHGSVPHGPLPHGPMPHGPMPFQRTHPQELHYGAPYQTSTHSPGYHGSHPQSPYHPHPGHFREGHPPNVGHYGYQDIHQHGYGGPSQQTSFKSPSNFGKDNSKDKKDHQKFKRDSKRKVRKNKAKKDEQVKKEKSDSSSSSSDTD